MGWRIISYIRHLFYFRHRHGHGIHSPFLFEFVNGVLFNGRGIRVPASLLEEHRKLRAGHAFIRRASVSLRYGSLLYRISNWFQPHMLIELGTGMGLSSLYLSSGSPGVALHTIERDRERASFASGLVDRICPGAVKVHQGEMDEMLDKILPLVPSRFMAFVDGNHQGVPTVSYVRKLLEKAGDEAVVVMDDIYWSKDMYLAWKTVSSWPEVQISLDLFHMGILLLKKDLVKTKIKIKF